MSWADQDVYAREAIDIHVDETAGLQYKEVKNPMIEIDISNVMDLRKVKGFGRISKDLKGFQRI